MLTENVEFYWYVRCQGFRAIFFDSGGVKRSVMMMTTNVETRMKF
jgi:hypothetical protein